jgi:hypothetical protein
MPPHAGGEGMTGSRYRLPPSRDTGPDERHAPHTAHQEHHPEPFPALHSVRRPAPASRPSGRYAVGLRPSLDPDASPRRAPNPARKNKQNSHPPLTGPTPSGMTCTDDIFGKRSVTSASTVDRVVSVRKA